MHRRSVEQVLLSFSQLPLERLRELAVAKAVAGEGRVHDHQVPAHRFHDLFFAGFHLPGTDRLRPARRLRQAVPAHQLQRPGPDHRSARDGVVDLTQMEPVDVHLAERHIRGHQPQGYRGHVGGGYVYVEAVHPFFDEMPPRRPAVLYGRIFDARRRGGQKRPGAARRVDYLVLEIAVDVLVADGYSRQQRGRGRRCIEGSGVFGLVQDAVEHPPQEVRLAAGEGSHRPQGGVTAPPGELRQTPVLGRGAYHGQRRLEHRFVIDGQDGVPCGRQGLYRVEGGQAVPQPGERPPPAVVAPSRAGVGAGFAQFPPGERFVEAGVEQAR